MKMTREWFSNHSNTIHQNQKKENLLLLMKERNNLQGD